MKYKNTAADAKKYNRKKDTKSKTVDCSDCGDTIPMNGKNCVAFGVYACQTCRKGEKMINDDKPQNAEKATPEERAAVLENSRLSSLLPVTDCKHPRSKLQTFFSTSQDLAGQIRMSPQGLVIAVPIKNQSKIF